MARPKNDGRGRLGGRAKGTPNKKTGDKDFHLGAVDIQQRRDQEGLRGTGTKRQGSGFHPASQIHRPILAIRGYRRCSGQEKRLRGR